MANYILVINNSIYWLFVLLFWCHYWVKRREMKKNYIIGSIILLIIVVLFSWFMVYTDSKKQEQANSMIPSIGQKLWTYNMNAHIKKQILMSLKRILFYKFKNLLIILV